MPKKKQNLWRNRIIGSGIQAAGQFLAHPSNYRRHPNDQEETLVKVLGKVGWVQEVIVSKRTGYTLDGHLRVKAALAVSEDEPVPYKLVDVTEAEEELILSVYDPISALAGRDETTLENLIGMLSEDDAALARMLHGERKRPSKVVSFEAAPSFEIIVECENETKQSALLARLRGEGYSCRSN